MSASSLFKKVPPRFLFLVRLITENKTTPTKTLLATRHRRHKSGPVLGKWRFFFFASDFPLSHCGRGNIALVAVLSGTGTASGSRPWHASLHWQPSLLCAVLAEQDQPLARDTSLLAARRTAAYGASCCWNTATTRVTEICGNWRGLWRSVA